MTLVVKKTTTAVGKKKTVTRKITAVNVPVYPNHTDRSVFINQQALPMLVQEALAAQFTGGINMISGRLEHERRIHPVAPVGAVAAKKV